MKPEVIKVQTKEISCDGNGDDSGHPLIYLNMGCNDQTVCPYCGRTFTVKG